MHPLTTAAGGHTKGPSRQLRCHAIVQHAAVPNAATRGGLYVSVHMPPVASSPLFPGALLAALCSCGYPVSVWQAEEAVANLPLRLAVRVHYGTVGGVL